jgi:hypothetical protein
MYNIHRYRERERPPTGLLEGKKSSNPTPGRNAVDLAPLIPNRPNAEGECDDGVTQQAGRETKLCIPPLAKILALLDMLQR